MLSEAEEHGASYWQAVVLRGMLSDPRFCADPLALVGNPVPLVGDWR